MQVWVTSRRRWLVLTPEEEVRRRLVAHLMTRLSVPATHIAEEYPIELNGQSQRADVVVFDMQMRPWMVVECKAPDVAITREVLAQAVRYNSILCAPVVVLTNGRDVRAYQNVAEGRYEPCDFPL
jgi:hypothetical protein